MVIRATLIVFLMVIIIIPLLYPANAVLLTQVVDCSAKGSVILVLIKDAYFPGETLDGDILITNNFNKDANMIYGSRLLKDNEVIWERLEQRTVPPGDSIYSYKQIFGPMSTPFTAESGSYILELNAQFDECLFTNAKFIEVFSCSDGKKNGNEQGIDCGGSCEASCAATITYPDQVIHYIAYYKEVLRDNWIPVTLNRQPSITTYKQNTWIDGAGINFDIPKESVIVATYGCCCTDCNNKFQCATQEFNEEPDKTKKWECGWNVKPL